MQLEKSFFQKGYTTLNIFTEREATDFLKKIEKYFYKVGRKRKIIIPNLKNYHLINIPEKKHKSIMHPNVRQIKIPKSLVKKIFNNRILNSITKKFYGDKKINIFQEYKNSLRTNKTGVRIVKPYAPISGIHAESNSSPGWDPITLWCPLIGFNNNYTLRIAPYSHKKKHPLKEIIKSKKYLAKSYSKKYLKNFKFIRPNMKIGQALVFHPNLLHGGAACEGKYCRVSFEVRLMKEESFIKHKNYFTLPKNTKRKIRFSNKYLSKKYY